MQLYLLNVHLQIFSFITVQKIFYNSFYPFKFNNFCITCYYFYTISNQIISLTIILPSINHQTRDQKMTIANRLKENESFVPTTKIPVHTNFPPNPVREIIFSKEKFELGCLKSFYPKKKQPKSSQGILKTYCAELYSQTIDENTKSFPIAIDECNNLLGAVNLAAHKMFPLVLTPEVIWFTILQGVTTHLNFHPEISTDISEAPVEQDHFVKEGNEKLEWTAIVDSIGDIFKQKYQKGSLPVRKISLTRIEPEASFNPLLATNGSTTASAMSMRTCQGLTAANATQSPNEFKRYNVIVQSCIPSIHVRGTAQDYEAIIGKVNEMSSKFALDWWASELIPVLNEFIKAVHGTKKNNNSSFLSHLLK